MNLLQHSISYYRFLISSVSPEKAVFPLPEGLFDSRARDFNGFSGHFTEIEAVKQDLIRRKEMIRVTDLGAGPGADLQKERSVSDIASSSSQRQKFSLLQYKLIRHFCPGTILELGTSFGFTTALFSKAAPGSKVVTIEGCHATAAIAAENFRQLAVHNIEQINGSFDESLDLVLSKYKKLDYIFFDGNHRKVPTLNYFIKLLSFRGERSIFVFDDIRWSAQMAEAWKEICLHPDITLSLDLYSLGILFFDPAFPKKHIQVRY